MTVLLTRLFGAWRRARRTRPGAPTKSAAARGPLAVLLMQVRFDLLASFRNPRARFFTFVFPIVLLVILAGVFGNGITHVDGVAVHLSKFYVPGILAMSIITVAYAGLVVTVASARETGVLKRRRATPVSPAILLGAQALSTLVTTAGVTVVLLVIGRLAYGVALAPGALIAIACTVIVGTLSFACIGYALAGLIGSVDSAQPIVQATVMPLYFISGIWIPNVNLSPALRSVASVFPVEHLASAMHLASVRSGLGAALSPHDLLLLAIWGVGAAAIAVRRFSWLPSTATA